MKTLKLFSKLMSSFFSNGSYLKIRFAWGKKKEFQKLLRINSARSTPLNEHEKVLVVGSGIASLSLLKNLHSTGHKNVTLLIKDQAFGGKCVNYGCMPSEYFSIQKELQPQVRIQKGKETIAKLRSVTEETFRSLNYPIHLGELTKVTGDTAQLSDGSELKFDRLVLATGHRTAIPPILGETFPISKFWELDCKNLLIVSDGNVSSLSYAAAALDQGINPIVVFTERLAISHLPSFQYFQKLLSRRGAKIIFDGKIVRRVENSLQVTAGSKPLTLNFDEILYNGNPEINVPEIDGKKPSVFDVNYQTGTICGRENVCVFGDAAGLLTATEAEFQANLIMRTWKTGELVDMSLFNRMPYRLHASPSLAMVGDPWTLLQKNWQVIDFKTLGWSLLHGEEGKLWYLYDATSNCIDAMHICHENASDLISMASLLLDVPLSNAKWQTLAIHPSSFEIFKVLREEILRSSSNHSYETHVSHKKDLKVYSLPPLALIERSPFFKNNFSEEERKIGILDTDPKLYFSILFALKSMSGQPKSVIPLRRASNGKYIVANGDAFEYVSISPTTILVRKGGKEATVDMSVQDENIAV